MEEPPGQQAGAERQARRWRTADTRSSTRLNQEQRVLLLPLLVSGLALKESSALLEWKRECLGGIRSNFSHAHLNVSSGIV